MVSTTALRRSVLAILLFAGSGVTLGADAIDLKGGRLEVRPSAIQLSGKDRQQQLVVTVYYDDSRAPIDVTEDASVQLDDPAMASVHEALVQGLREGQTTLRVQIGQLVAEVPVTVTDYTKYPDVHFESDIVPVFSKLGCNSGGCHGKQSGQNGFKLSVFGFDPRADYESLVHAARGRRVFPGAVERSLIYAKAVGRSAHGGGQRMSEDSQDAELLREWLKQGMPWGSENASTVTGIAVWPERRIMASRSRQQLRVVATFSDGRTRDVTRAAAYTSNQEVIAGCDTHGRIDAGLIPGEAAITISYAGSVTVSRVVIPQRGDKLVQPPWFDDSHPIDKLTWNKWQQLRISPSELCDDATFLRRVKIKTTGTLPTAEQVQRFTETDSATKRQEAVTEALASDEFVSYWSQRWSDVLMVNSNSLGGRGAYAFHRWIREQIQTNRPYDQWVHDIIVASGNSGQVGPVNFYRGQRSPEDATKAVSQAFLGIRMDCAQCHHHPFEKWGQDDFYGLAGYFNGMTRQKLDESRELVYHPGHKSIVIPVLERPVSTRTLGGSATSADKNTDPRPELADWVTSRDNPYFARLVANRIWKHLMGRGLVEPEDDLRETNPPTNPELLDHLAETLVASDFDLKALMKHVMASKTFQLSSAPNDSNHSDDQTYSHYIVRRMPAEVMLDAICQVTGVPEAYAGYPTGSRAIELWDNQLPSYFLDTFGRSLRESPCECGSSGEPTMSQALHLLNSPEIEVKIQSRDGRAAKFAKTQLTTDQLIQQIALVTVNRRPTQREQATGRKLIANSTREQGIQDFMWVMMNSYDFLFVK
jgi:hypothetical protein